MNRWFGAILIAAALIRAELVWGGYPTYMVLRPQAKESPHPQYYERYPGQANNVTAQGYAYGWFGAHAPRPHWSRHFGYYRNFTEWSGK